MGFSEYIVYLFNFALAMGAVLAFIVIVAAGIKILESRGNPSEISEAKQKIINCFIGLAVLLTSYILLTTINPGIINIQNINLGNTGITVPIITPIPVVEEIKNYTFEEIPLGTITEGILAGNSSERNGLPCYEYLDDAENPKDASGRIVIGDTIDQNGDGLINSKDYLFNKDIFYCIKLLDKAIKNKTEIHLKTLVNELNLLLQQKCFCTNCYEKRLNWEPTYPGDSCDVVFFIPCVPYNGRDCSNYNPTPSRCSTCDYTCGCCGNYQDGCKDAPTWSEENKVGQPCKNPEIINCKRQEIKQLVDGSRPEDYCYEEGYITWWDENSDNRNGVDQTLLTYQKAMQRMAYFKQYYIDEVAELTKAETKMKDPYGERLSSAELYNNVETRSNVSVTKATFDGYDISRYCRESNCVEYDTETDEEGNQIIKLDQYGQKVCNKYDFNEKNRVCKTDATMECEDDDQACKDAANQVCKDAEGDAEREACKEYYTYAGDAATFYYSSEYNDDYKGENQVVDQSDNKCNVAEQDIDKEMYGGLIPIGETVDYTEAWGTEVARTIKTMIDEVNGIATTALTIADFPTQCECGANCKQSVPIECCFCPCEGEGCCQPKSCQYNECSTCEAREVYKTSTCDTLSVIYANGCLSCTGRPRPLYSSKSAAKPSYYVCPFKNMCNYVRLIYQTGDISNTCFYASSTDEEETEKEIERKKIGYLTRFEIRERMLFNLAGMNITNGTFSAGAAALFPELDCLTGCDEVISTGITCDSSTSPSIPNRFTLFNMLKTSRERITGCVKGYSFPYKQTADNVRVISCYEADNSSLVILPEFPYPDMSNAKDEDNNPTPYINCYPYNSSSLTQSQKEICFYNINRTGTASNPGCLTITKNYMDNYYCCQ